MGTSRSSSYWFAILLSLAGCLFFLSGDSFAQDFSPNQWFFDEVGHQVAKEFGPFFDAHGGIEVIGYPITEVFLHHEENLWVQYFQNTRIEVDLAEGEIRLSPIPEGMYWDMTRPPIPPDQVPAGAMYFEPTGHSVMLAFLDFYLEYGGPSFFGYPITELVNEGDRLTQYFERAVFEWRPDMPDGQRVQLVRLGMTMYWDDGIDEELYGCLLCASPIPAEVLGIQVSAAVQKPVMQQVGGSQKVYVHVYDQLGRPVSDAQVDVSIFLPQGGEVRGPKVPTDEHGVVAFDMTIPALAPGETVPIHVSATYRDLWQKTACSFRVWW